MIRRFEIFQIKWSEFITATGGRRKNKLQTSEQNQTRSSVNVATVTHMFIDYQQQCSD
jgi:hypothetical protein